MTDLDASPPTGPPARVAPQAVVADLAIEAAQIGLFELDLRTGALTWDARTLELFGHDEQSFDSSLDAFWTRVHPDDAALVGEALDTAIQSRGEFFEEYRVVLPDGTERWVAARCRVVAVGEGPAATEVLIGAVSDATEKRAQDARVAQVLETMPTAFYSLDREWRFAYVNDRACDLLQRSREELLGQVVWDLYPSALGTLFEHSFARVMSARVPVSFDAYYPAPLDGWFEVHAWPAGDQVAVYFLDVSERYLAQARADRAARALSIVAELGTVVAYGDEATVAQRIADALAPHFGDWGVVSVTEGAGRGAGLTGVAGWQRDPDRSRLVAGVVAAVAADSSLHVVGGGAGPGGRTDHSGVIGTGQVRVLGADDIRAPVQAGADAAGLPDALDRLAPTAALEVLFVVGGLPVVRVTACYDDEPVPSDATALAQEVVRRSVTPLENAFLARRQTRVVEAFQRSLLVPPPQMDHLEVAVRYLPASDAARVGGDWYDAVALPGGSALFVIGDVVGHDIEAAAAMGQVRSLVRGVAAATGLGPAALLTRVDEVLSTLGAPVIATAACVRIEAHDGAPTARVVWSSAGHPAPALHDASGRTTYLQGENGLLLGVAPEARRHDWEVELERGATLLLFTDGLVETRDATLPERLDALAGVLDDVGREPLDALCDAVLERMLGTRGPADDVALLAVRLRGD